MLPEAENDAQVIEPGSTLKLTCVKELGDDNEDDEMFWTNDVINENNREVIQRFHFMLSNIMTPHHLILTRVFVLCRF